MRSMQITVDGARRATPFGISFSLARAVAGNLSATFTERLWTDRYPRGFFPGASRISPGHMVGLAGDAPAASCMSSKRSTDELKALLSFLVPVLR